MEITRLNLVVANKTRDIAKLNQKVGALSHQVAHALELQGSPQMYASLAPQPVELPHARPEAKGAAFLKWETPTTADEVGGSCGSQFGRSHRI
jgi:hypothetical protein